MFVNATSSLVVSPSDTLTTAFYSVNDFKDEMEVLGLVLPASNSSGSCISDSDSFVSLASTLGNSQDLNCCVSFGAIPVVDALPCPSDLQVRDKLLSTDCAHSPSFTDLAASILFLEKLALATNNEEEIGMP